MEDNNRNAETLNPVYKLILRIETLMDKMTKQSSQIAELTNTIKADRKSELSTPEAAAYLGVKPKTIHNYLAAGKIHGFKKGKFRYFLKSELDDFLKAQV